MSIISLLKLVIYLRKIGKINKKRDVKEKPSQIIALHGPKEPVMPSTSTRTNLYGIV